MITLAGVSGFPLGHGLVHALGWTLLHFCWQGALVAGLLWCVLALMGRHAARARYGAACVALLLMTALPLVTFARLAAAEPRGGVPVAIPAFVLDVSADGADGAREPLRQRIAEGLDTAAAWIPAVWGVGLLLFLGRLNFGLIMAGRLKSAGTDAAPVALQEAFERLRARLGVTRAVRLVQSAVVQVPTVIGWLRPVVLVPMGCFLGLSTAQVEALLAHELAHVRRHDYLVSVLQSVVEALLFYHPAVWWVSRQVRRERECCCDELAVGVGGNALAYARALTSLEEYRAAMPAMVLSANGGVLTMRIKRLLGRREDSAVSQVAALLILSAVMVVAGSYVVTAARAQGTTGHTAILRTTVQLAGQPQITLTSDASVAAKVSSRPDMSCSYYGGTPFREHAGTCEEDGTNAGHYLCRTNEDGGLVQTQVGCEWKVKRFQEWQRNHGAPAKDADVEAHGAPLLLADSIVRSPRATSVIAETGGTIRGVVFDQTGAVLALAQVTASDAHGLVVLSALTDNAGGFSLGSLSPASYTLEVRAVGFASVRKENVRVDAGRASVFNIRLKVAEANQALTVSSPPLAAAVKAEEPPPAPPARTDGKPARVSAGVMAGNAISQPAPVYPVEAKAAHVQGVVVLHAVISKAGTVEDLNVVSGPPELIVSAIDAVRQWRYKPYLLNGEPTAVETTININYTFGEAPPAEPGEFGGAPVRKVGDGVSAPVAIYEVEPEFSAEAKAAKSSGVVVVRLIVDAQGVPQNVQVLRGVGNGLDEKAVEAVKQYRFKPAMEGGTPVPVLLNVEVNFKYF